MISSVKVAILLACVAVSCAYSFEYPVELEDAVEELSPWDVAVEPMYILPLPLAKQRVRRQTIFGGVTPGNPGGVQGTVGARGTLFENNGHRLDGHGSVSRNWHPTGPTTIGGGLDYTGPRGSASVSAQHQHRFGTTIGAEGRANLYRSPNGMTSVDAHGSYQRHFGGPFGTSRPNYNVGLGLSHRF
ncbi:attacin-B-like [Lutzomyia longipalpis]|uniref:Putative attacin n=1 Tax=Lutzomyia longipalpis TaxID=7200 RepID=A0A7G3A895_LUTLO|nr:attacin-B-like [Lutzomyia longipalpis]